MNKNESKYFNTAVKMDEALISLLEKKAFEYITVKEICDVARVNRSTFYLHYENTSDLLSEATRYILDRFMSYFHVDTQGISHSYKESELKDLIFITPEYLSPYLTFIKDNKSLFKTSIKHLGTMGFYEIYKKMFQYIFEPILIRFHYSVVDREYVVKFYLSGITAIVVEWLDKNCSDSIEDIIRIITLCILGKNDENR